MINDIIRLLNLKKVSEERYRCLCPFHKEKEPSFYLHTEKGYYCFGCGAKGSVEHLARYLGINIEKTNTEKNIANDWYKEYKNNFSYKRFEDFFLTRNLKKEFIDRFNIGYSEKDDALVIPYFWGMEIVRLKLRMLHSNNKYLTKKIKDNNSLFGLQGSVINNTGILYIVEAEWDCIKMHQCGYNSVAIGSSLLQSWQVETIYRHYNTVCLIPDNDTGGVKSIIPNIVALLTQGINNIYVILLDKIEPTDYTDEELKDRISTLPVFWTTYCCNVIEAESNNMPIQIRKQYIINKIKSIAKTNYVKDYLYNYAEERFKLNKYEFC